MRLLDLYCGAGGAAMGYHQAGFTEIIGVDIEAQPNYPFDFVQGDALSLGRNLIAEGWEHIEPMTEGWDLIHASPPCQAYSTQGRSSRWGTEPSSPPLIPQTRALLEASGIPYVIENVAGARAHLKEPMVALRGHQFGLGVDRLRYFELGGWFTLQEPRTRREPGLVLGVYGRAPDGRRLAATRTKEQLRAPRSVAEAAEAMGIDWCDDWRGIAEAIPPAYTRYIGEAFLSQHAASRQGDTS